MRSLLYVLLTAAALAMTSCSQEKAAAVTETETVRLHIEGMSCGENCPPQVERMLGEVDGVTACDVDFDTKTATVTVAKGTDAAKLTAAVTEPFAATLAGS